MGEGGEVGIAEGGSENQQIEKAPLGNSPIHETTDGSWEGDPIFGLKHSPNSSLSQKSLIRCVKEEERSGISVAHRHRKQKFYILAKSFLETKSNGAAQNIPSLEEQTCTEMAET